MGAAAPQGAALLACWWAASWAVTTGAGASGGSAYSFFNQGRELHMQGDLEGARAAYQEAAKLSPTYGDALYGMGLVAEELGLHEEAASHYASAMAVDPGSQASSRARDLKKLVAMEPRKLGAAERRTSHELMQQVLLGEGELPGGPPASCTGPPYLRAWKQALHEDLLVALEESWTTYLRHKNFNEDMQVTYWHAKARFKKPKNAVELAILKLRPLVPLSDEELVGAEWWPRRHVTKQGMNLHVDQDMTTKNHMQKFPAYSSVLYLSDGGATYVLKQSIDTQGKLVPPLPHNSTVAYPERGLFAVFDGSLVHGVLPPAEAVGSNREVLVVNWWRTRPNPPACNELPAAVGKPHYLGKEVLKRLAALKSERESVNATCLPPEAIEKGRRFSTFGGIYRVPLPVPSAHSPGQVLVIDWAALAAARGPRRGEL